MAAYPPETVRYWIEAAVQDCLSADDFLQFEDALRNSPAVRQQYLEAIQIHGNIKALAQKLPNPPKAVIDKKVPRVAKSSIAIYGSALCLLVLATSTFVFRPLKHSHESEMTAVDGVALKTEERVVSDVSKLPILIESANARLYGEWHSPVPGQTFAIDKDYVLTQGFLGLKFHAGARAFLKAPCVFNVVDDATIQIRSGQCSVFAPPGAEGFRVLSPTAEVVDLGTRFVVDVADTGETELLVVDGEATISPAQKTTFMPIHLKEGQAARVEPGLLPQYAKTTSRDFKYLSSLPDRVVRYEATMTPENYADELLTLSVQRGGELEVYNRESLIRSKVVHFVSTQDAATFCTRQGEALPDREQRLDLLNSDWSLVTGIINPRLLDFRPESIKYDPVMTFEFAEPIVNGPGPDIVLFDLQLLVYPVNGDPLRLRSGDRKRKGLKEVRIEQFDIDLTSREALDLVPHRTYRALLPTTGLDDLISNEFRHGRQVHVNAKAIAVGIDLSDFGYAMGESMKRLDIMETEERHNIDPVLVVGLPAIHTLEELAKKND